MAIIGPLISNPSGVAGIMQTTGAYGDIVVGPINFAQSGIATGIVPAANLPPGIIASGIASGTPVGGDATGVHSSLQVIGIQGRSVVPTAPTGSQVLTWSSSDSAWEPSYAPSTIVEGQDYSFANASSDIGGYNQLQNSNSGSESDLSVSVTLAGGKQLIKAFASVASSPGVSIIPAGLWEFNYYGYVNLLGAFTTNLIFDVYTRTTGGTETLLFSAAGQNLTVTSVGLFTLLFNYPNDTIIDNTQRLVIKVSAITTSAAGTTAHFVFDGSTHASLVRTPIAGAALQLGGDLSGTTDSTTVIKLQGNSVLSQSLSSSNDQYVLTWNNATTNWQAKIGPTGPGTTTSYFQAGVTGYTGQYVVPSGKTFGLVQWNQTTYTGAGNLSQTTLTGTGSAWINLGYPGFYEVSYYLSATGLQFTDPNIQVQFNINGTGGGGSTISQSRAYLGDPSWVGLTGPTPSGLIGRSVSKTFLVQLGTGTNIELVVNCNGDQSRGVALGTFNNLYIKQIA